MEITWGILFFTFGAGFLAATLFAVLIGFWIRGAVSTHSKTIQTENEQMRATIAAYQDSYKQMRATPPAP